MSKKDLSPSKAVTEFKHESRKNIHMELEHAANVTLDII